MNAFAEPDFRYLSLLTAANSPSRVNSLTHRYYRYPARFGETFVREAIQNFSKPGSTVLDPFCGGGTTVVEALSLGRDAIGSDLSALAIAVTKAKSTLLSDRQLDRIEEWVHRTSGLRSELFQAPIDPLEQRLQNLPLRHRRLVTGLTAELEALPTGESRAFARCLLLRTMQWALDSKESLPSPSEILDRIPPIFQEMRKGMDSLRLEIENLQLSKRELHHRRNLINCPADFIDRHVERNRVSLVVTSPPYLGVHVLYNRWQLQGRRELKIPFYIANCPDLGSSSKYTIVPRRTRHPERYFQTIQNSFTSISKTLVKHGLVIQLVSFSDAQVSIEPYLTAMRAAGLQLCETYEKADDDHLWRSVPGRRWYARVGAVENSSASKEILLVHRRE